ncbi:unnamed protein product (macronuclear) [Paramecium tetraurelia]|uniref:Uncharacterized protein n=1 Tax=Paramecium tetraurelia TaxID=5888 RepID=A0EEX9_PARTE|nr:uncharacterized protein GSPATT00026193001 [Paramecium tetraurelia]CAK93870.1 unnamed protein product [Paramecium tetraurelia]|eukprot:XP_001461243.1 hypothetical protein (macronuclear) [Paramecium tetraurelia strain d4-2]
MLQYDTDFGKIFYCIYTLHKSQLISIDRKSKLKDMLITFDEKMTALLTSLPKLNEHQVQEHLLMMADSQYDSNPNIDFELSEENYSIRSSHTLQQTRAAKPKKIIIEKSTYKLVNKSQFQYTARSSKRTATQKLT